MDWVQNSVDSKYSMQIILLNRGLNFITNILSKIILKKTLIIIFFFAKWVVW